jgi:RND family efflux transporter MFP subunit
MVVVALVLGAVVALVKVGKPAIEASLFKTEVAVAEVASVSPSQASIEVTSSGYVVPQVVARVGTKVMGRIKEVKAREGQHVAQGAVLFVLDPSDQRSAVSASQARVGAASARVAAAKASLAEAEILLARQKALVAANAAAPATAEDLQARVNTLKEQVRAQQSEVVAAQADVSALAVGLGHTQIVAPISGVLATKPPEVGDMVTPNAPLVELIDFGSLLIETDVPEARLAKVKAGGSVAIMLDALGGEPQRGSVVEVGPRLNRAKGTATVKIRFEAIPPEVRPEMSARVNFLSRALSDAEKKSAAYHVVPNAAVVHKGADTFVWLIENDKVRRVSVVLGDTKGTDTVLVQGPPPGTKLVRDPPTTLADGNPVKEKAR